MDKNKDLKIFYIICDILWLTLLISISLIIVRFGYNYIHEGAHGLACFAAGLKPNIYMFNAECPGIEFKKEFNTFIWFFSPYLVSFLIIILIVVFNKRIYWLNYLVLVPYLNMMLNYIPSITHETTDFIKILRLGKEYFIFSMIFVIISSLIVIFFSLKKKIYKCPFKLS